MTSKTIWRTPRTRLTKFLTAFKLLFQRSMDQSIKMFTALSIYIIVIIICQFYIAGSLSRGVGCHVLCAPLLLPLSFLLLLCLLSAQKGGTYYLQIYEQEMRRSTYINHCIPDVLWRQQMLCWRRGQESSLAL